MTTLFAFLHHLAAFTVVAAIAVEFVLLRGEISVWSARRILAADAILGGAAALLLAVGLMRVFYFEKGAAYYFASHAFMGKFAIFIALAVFSVVPTLEFVSWRKDLRAGRAPAPDARKLRMVRAVVHGELAGIVLILLFAAMMARGGWV